MKKKRYLKALTIAGTDSGGGAGVQADLKTFSALGCFGMSVLTSLTAQNTKEVVSIHPVSDQFISEQFDAILEDIGTDVIKTGMLHRASAIETVALKLQKYSTIPVVVDPVVVAQSGAVLLNEDALDNLKELLFPRALLITPNLEEASLLLGRKIDNLSEMETAARELLKYGCQAVLVKGGHLKEKKGSDCLAINKQNGDTKDPPRA